MSKKFFFSKYFALKFIFQYSSTQVNYTPQYIIYPIRPYMYNLLHRTFEPLGNMIQVLLFNCRIKSVIENVTEKCYNFYFHK